MTPEEPEASNGRASIREVRDLLQDHEEAERTRSDEFRTWLDGKFTAMDEKYVLRAACIERHKYIDPRQIWAAAAVLAILGPAITAALIASF